MVLAAQVSRIFFSEFSPYSTLISGGQATKATLFYNNQRKKIGLVGFWDTVAFDEVGGIKVKDQDTIQIMKDFMANGRFSRGVEVIADASMAFVGNLDLSVSQIVNSEVYDLFQPLPKEFDLAVMDRFACYLPGWEMPKNSSEFLTNNYGFITDYLAEAFHYQLKQTNRYEEVNKRIRLGKSVEGRDEKGIKKTVAAFLKILHPSGSPTDNEFEEYVAYAVEARRRVKEQMNKRKSDDEFAKINLSYFNSDDKEIVVYCPESKSAPATQDPVRKDIHDASDGSENTQSDDLKAVIPKPVVTTRKTSEPMAVPAESAVIVEPVLQEQHYTIHYGATGYSYESIIGSYLEGAKSIEIEDPYVRVTHQIQNFVRFCEAVIKSPNIKRIRLITSYDGDTDLKEMSDRLSELQQSLLELDIELELKINEHLHDRQIKVDNGWVIKIGRGLDFFQKPDSWFTIGTNDLSLRKCLETNVDIFRV
ncbi:MAG: BREX system Lon protease-like protein BrxL [Shewanella xiamenensis]|nr:BREX system Lon protease-like protein BrxL [Shewanella xiamenensis]